MNVYTYRGSLLCEDCTRVVMNGSGLRSTAGMSLESIIANANRNADMADVDSEQVPQGPTPHGGGMADSPAHCGDCHRFLRNDLSAEGMRYVRQAMADAVAAGRINETVHEWAQFYSLAFDSAARALAADDAATFRDMLFSMGACNAARRFCDGLTLREAWAKCTDGDWLQWWLEQAGVEPSSMRWHDADGLRLRFDPVTAEEVPAVEQHPTPRQWLDTLAVSFGFSASPADDDTTGRAYSFSIARNGHTHAGTYYGPACPTAADVLGCMLLDSDSIDSARDWIEWGEDAGMFASGKAADVRKALQAFQESERERTFLRSVLGDDYGRAVEAARDL